MYLLIIIIYCISDFFSFSYVINFSGSIENQSLFIKISSPIYSPGKSKIIARPVVVDLNKILQSSIAYKTCTTILVNVLAVLH